MADGPRSGRRLVAICAVCCAIFGLVLAASAMPMLVSESPAGDQFDESDEEGVAGEQALTQEQAADSDGTGDEPAEGAPEGALANHADDVDSSILEGALLGLASILGDDATINPESLDGQFGSMLDSSGDIDPEDVDPEQYDGDIDEEDIDEEDFDEDEFEEEDIDDGDEFEEGEDGHEADDDGDDELSDGDEDGTGDDGPDDDADADDGSGSQDDDGSDTGDDGDFDHDADDGDATGSDDGDGATDGSDTPDGSDGDDSSESDTEDESSTDDDTTADVAGGNDDESDADDSDESADEERSTDENEDDDSDLAEMLPGLSGDVVTATLAALALLAVAYVFYTREDPIGTLRSIPGRLVSLALSSVVACSQALERAVDRLRGLSSIAELPGLVLATLAAALRSAETRVKTAASSVPLFGGETTAEPDAVEETHVTARERIRQAFESVIDAAPMYRTRVATATPAEVARGARNAGAPAEPVETITDTFRDVEYGDRDPESYLERTTTAHEQLQSALEAEAETEAEEKTAKTADPTDNGPTPTGASADE